MTDKKIDYWLDTIYKEKPVGYLLNNTLSGDNMTDSVVLRNVLDIDYLEKELCLVIRLLSDNKNSHFVKLSLKGLDVYKKGGWGKYKEDEESKKRIKKRKDNLKYWASIIIPFLMLLISFWQFKKDSKDAKNDIMQELQDKNKIIQQDLKRDIQVLTKKMDSVLLKTEQSTDKTD